MAVVSVKRSEPNMASVGTIVEFTIYPQRTFRTQALNMADGLQQKTNRYLERFPNANL